MRSASADGRGRFVWRDGAGAGSAPNLLFLSHCVPNPPDKGEKIRAFHLLRRVAQEYRVHLVCFARSAADLEAAAGLRGVCASIYSELLPYRAALLRGVTGLVAGGSLNESFFRSGAMRRAVHELVSAPGIDATLAYTAVMAPYAPDSAPVFLDMVDVDSEKWFQYAALRFPGALYGVEARRLRAFERAAVGRSRFTLLTTANEEALLKSFAPAADTGFMENGVDASYFDAAPRELDAALRGSRFVAFIGAMDYYPNVDGVARFAAEVFPELRRRDPGLEFFIVGKNPAKAVQELAGRPGLRVLGAVPDVRPYLSAARAVVAPLRLARGIQNKVLEALAMGRPVIASAEVCRTFGDRLPRGVVRCASAGEMIDAVANAAQAEPAAIAEIRGGVQERFDWGRNLEIVSRRLKQLPG